MASFLRIPSPSRPEVNLHLAILVGVVVACAIPFLRQPFHMDDNFYLDMARNAQSKPMFPNDTSYNFEGRLLPDMGSHSHPPLQTYFLAALQIWFGEAPGSEWFYHAAALIYPVVAVVAMYFLSARFVERPLWPSLVLGATPLVMVMQHTLMTDIPNLAYWLAAIASFLWATEKHSAGLYAASGVFQLGALFTSYQSVALSALLGFYQVRRGKGLAGYLAIGAPVLFMVGWFVINYLHYDRMLLYDTLGYIESRSPFSSATLQAKFFGFMQYQGWLIIFPLFLVYSLGRHLGGRTGALALIASLYLTQLVVPRYGTLEKVIFTIGLATSALILGWMTLFALKAVRGAETETGFGRVEAEFLALWYFGIVVACLLLFTEGSARYLLPLVPPLLIWFFRRLEMTEVTEYRLERPPLLKSATVASGSLVLSFASAVALAHADHEFARVYPRSANEVRRVAPGLGEYYAGEWGFRYYFQQAEFKQLPVDESRVMGGSVIASPTLALPHQEPLALRTMLMPFLTLEYAVPTPLRLLDRETHAAFYSTGWGLLPFSFSSKPVERIEIRQVNFMVERLPWAEIHTESGVKPWPGYLSVQGDRPLALLVKPHTRICYRWSAQSDLLFEVRVGVSPESYESGENTSFLFEIDQLNVGGRTIASESVSLRPGVVEEDRRWKTVRVALKSQPDGGDRLEFRYSASTNSANALGAFAASYLRRGK